MGAIRQRGFEVYLDSQVGRISKIPKLQLHISFLVNGASKSRAVALRDIEHCGAVQPLAIAAWSSIHSH